MFPALFAHNWKHWIYNNWYTLCVQYVGWLLSGLEFHSNPGSSQPTVYTVPPDYEQIVLKTCRGC
jgi:hypothetical protein